MKFEIIWSESAIKELEKIERLIAKRIFNKVLVLENEPYRYVQKLVGSPFFKLRVGDYRVIIEIKHHTLQILVIKVGHRKNIYD